MAKKAKKKSTGKKTQRVSCVDINGNKITGLANWKVRNPGKIYFESTLELDCYNMLKASGVDFDYHPDSRELQESFSAWTLSLKTRKVFKAKVRNISYTSDFLVHCPNGLKVYIEAKGFFHADSRLRYKMFQNKLKSDEMTFLVKSTLDLKYLLKHIKEEYSTPSNIKKEIINITI